MYLFISRDVLGVKVAKAGMFKCTHYRRRDVIGQEEGNFQQ